jgi:hypothetical protein
VTERWRRPILPIAIETDTKWIDHVSGVRTPFERVELVLHDADVKRLREGYGCMNCLEPFEKAWPVNCSVCNYPVRERQSFEFSANYNGTEPALTPLEEKLALLDEEDARKAYDSP